MKCRTFLLSSVERARQEEEHETEEASDQDPECSPQTGSSPTRSEEADQFGGSSHGRAGGPAAADHLPQTGESTWGSTPPPPAGASPAHAAHLCSLQRGSVKRAHEPVPWIKVIQNREASEGAAESEQLSVLDRVGHSDTSSTRTSQSWNSGMRSPHASSAPPASTLRSSPSSAWGSSR